MNSPIRYGDHAPIPESHDIMDTRLLCDRITWLLTRSDGSHALAVLHTDLCTHHSILETANTLQHDTLNPFISHLTAISGAYPICPKNTHVPQHKQAPKIHRGPGGRTKPLIPTKTHILQKGNALLERIHENPSLLRGRTWRLDRFESPTSQQPYDSFIVPLCKAGIKNNITLNSYSFQKLLYLTDGPIALSLLPDGLYEAPHILSPLSDNILIQHSE